ncbi:GNAT family N-acetyltransferase [Armatimonas sp.]|uniref:GNAT family N-acetyltransferase n=1 Tax=Armatimonas sp. TaxID=1872638 RepID=UPI00286A8449|nr:GNAT family N-acetyltransferase [Armatimonas sp.]
MNLVCRLIATDEDLAACLSLRRRVFIEEQCVPEEIERDSDDTSALHFLAWVGSTPVAVARVVNKGDGVAKIGRVAVLLARRGEGIGGALMEFVLTSLAEYGFTQALLHSQEPVVGFYEKLGFATEGERFFEAEIPHFAMRKRLYSTG